MSRTARRTIGAVEITVLNDGSMEFPGEVFPDVADEEVNALLGRAGKSSIETNFNALHVRTAKDSILIDSGTGGLFGPTAGFLDQALSEAEISPESITHFVITHLHPDHIGGAITGDGAPAYGNAELVISDVERQFWTDETNFSGADEQAREWQQLAVKVLKTYGDRVTAAGPGAEVVSGIHLEELPGHTKGHVGLRIESDGIQFLYAADILHAQDLQLANPNICAAFDADKDMATRTRKRTLDLLATDRILFAGAHFLNRMIGRVERSSAGFAILPA